MITLKLLTEFTHDVLRYKKSVSPFDFKDYGNFIHIFFDKMGESVSKEVYYDWLSKRREKKISKILDNKL